MFKKLATKKNLDKLYMERILFRFQHRKHRTKQSIKQQHVLQTSKHFNTSSHVQHLELLP